MEGWQSKPAALKLGAPMTKEEREAADKPAAVMQWAEVWNPNAWTVNELPPGYVVIDIPTEYDALAGQFIVSE